MAQCVTCGAGLKPGATRCVKCGTSLDPVPPAAPPPQAAQYTPPASGHAPYAYAAKSRVVYVLLGIFLGSLGIHNFYIGRTGRAVVQLLLTVLTCFYGAFITWIWAIIDVCTVTTDSNHQPLA